MKMTAAILALLAVLVFALCWITMMLTGIIMAVTQTRLNKYLNINHPSIRNNLGFSISNIEMISDSPFGVFNVIYRFGSKSATEKYISRMVDINAIDQLNDEEAIGLKNRLIRANSNFVRVWTIMFLSVIVGGISIAIFSN